MARSDEHRLVEVVLEDDASSPAGPGAGDRHDDDGAGRPRARPGARGGRWVLAVVAVVVLALGAADVLAERRERAALAAAAHLPGVVGSLALPVEEAWRVPAGALTAVPGTVVTVDDGALVGLDAGTGEPRWSVTLPAGGGCPLGVPAQDGAPGSGALLCVGVGGRTADPDAGGATDRVVAHVVDPGDGRVRAEVRGPRQLLDGAVVEEDLVLVGWSEGRLTVSRHELVQGSERWRTVLDGFGRGPRDVHVHGDDQVVAVEGPTTVVLDADDGRELGRWDVGPDGGADGDADPDTMSRARVVSHPGTGFGVWTTTAGGRWYAPDGAPGVALAGEPVEPEVDDGSAPGTVLLRTADDRLRAVDVGSGQRVWDRPAPRRVLLRLAGRLVVSGDGRVEAWDATTGEVAWSVVLEPGHDPGPAGPYTDGVRLAVPGWDDDALGLTVYRIADGARLWSAPMPAGTQFVTVLGDRLVAVGRLDGGPAQSAAVLGPPGS